GEVAPFAQDLAGTAGGGAGPLAAHAVRGAEGVTDSVLPGYAHDIEYAGHQFHPYGDPHAPQGRI
ncbi:hypothetical protein ACWDTB_37220, partial [Streptomyces sp. NPDC003487]